MIAPDELGELLLAEGLSRKTVACYMRAAVAASRVLGDLDAVPASAIAAYAETLPPTRSSRALLRSALRAYARVTGAPLPWRAVRVPRHPRMRCRALDDVAGSQMEQTAASLAAAGDRRGVAVLVGLYTGMRRSEISSLRWSQLGADGWLHVSSKGAARSFPVHPIALAALRAWAAVAPSGPRIFTGAGGGELHPTTLWTWVRQVAALAGLPPVGVHVLRHTALSAALDRTGDLRAVQELAGHARPETTAGYTRVRRDRLSAAVAAIDYRGETPL